jgi:hypothetical protein
LRARLGHELARAAGPDRAAVEDEAPDARAEEADDAPVLVRIDERRDLRVGPGMVEEEALEIGRHPGRGRRGSRAGDLLVEAHDLRDVVPLERPDRGHQS